MSADLQPAVRAAIKSGPVPVIRDWRKLPIEQLTLGEQVCRFAEEFLHVPEGMHTGQPLVLDDWQVAFILATFDNPAITRVSICSLARRNGKSFVVAVILLAYILGPLAKRNITLASGALSRDQASLVYRLCEKMLNLSPKLNGLYRCVPSSKKIVGLAMNTEYRALSADGASNLGNSFNLVLLDEAGQIKGANNSFTEMLETSQGSFTDEQRPLMIILSTQAPSDADYLSQKIDDAVRSGNRKTVCHLYAADEGCDLLDEEQWGKANPGLGKYRSLSDLREQLTQAARLPAKESSARNLLLNQRVSAESMFIAPAVWKRNAGPIDEDVFRRMPTVMGLDLSARNDLTAAVLAARDEDGIVHVKPYVFCPTRGIEERSKRDRAPYADWVRDGFMVPIGGESMDYDQIAEYLRDTLDDEGIALSKVAFDRWRVDIFKAAAERCGFAQFAEWVSVGQGFRDMAPRLEALEGLLLEGRMRHGGHPLMNMAASNAIAVQDPAGARKLDKSKSTLRIDPLVAAVMAVYEVTDGEGEILGDDLSYWVA